MTIKELFWSKGYEYYPTDKDRNHQYLNTYGELFGKWEHSNINILEVGAYKGGSMRLFEEYFINANIISYDIKDWGDTNCKRAVRIIKDFGLVHSSELPELTIAIDDGAHDLDSQTMFLEKVYPRVVKGGIIVVEDIFTKDLQKAKERFNTLNIPYEIVSFFPPKDEDNDNLIIFRK